MVDLLSFSGGEGCEAEALAWTQQWFKLHNYCLLAVVLVAVF